MAQKEPVIAIIHTLTYQGRKLTGTWSELVSAFRSLMRQAALEMKGSSEILLLFSFSHPRVAISHVYESIARVKADFNWPTDRGPLPFQIVFHLQKKNDTTTNIFNPNAEFWNLLPLETPHVTRALRYRWQELMAGRKLPEHRFENEQGGLFRLVINNGESLRTEKLFPHRDLTQRGNQPGCFYCGMTTHVPAACPAKLLPPQAMALQYLGYLAFADLADSFHRAMINSERLAGMMGTGLKPAQLRANSELLVYVGYFDLFRIFQPRFLFCSCFSVGARWLVSTGERLRIDNRNLHMGLDCLRVGKYAHAEELFQKEHSKTHGKQFHALIGLAFTALERGRRQDMATCLDRARSMARTERESVYAGLLQARYYLLENEYYKAKEAVGYALKARPDCLDARYLDIQIEVQERLEEKTLQNLQKLVEEEREFFLVALMDPHLLPIHGFVEEIQAALVFTITGRADVALRDARNDCRELAAWLEADDDHLRQNQETLANLEKKFARRSYFDLLDVESRCSGLSFSCKKLINEALQGREKAVDRAIDRYDRLQRFWQRYPHKLFFSKFGDTLAGSRRLLTKAEENLKKRTSEAYRQAGELLDSGNRLLDRLQNTVSRMLWLQSALEGLGIFGKHLFLTETVLLLLSAVLFSAAGALPLPGRFADLLLTPLFQKQVTYIIVLVAAPALAIALTFRQLRDKKTS